MMKRVTVVEDEGESVAKGMVIADAEVKTVEELKIAVGTAIGREISSDEAVYCFCGPDEIVEVADVRFIRDGERLRVGRRRTGGTSGGAKGQSQGSAESRWLRLNVGGKLFLTSKSTVELRVPGSMLARMFSSETEEVMAAAAKDETGAFLIDRSPKYFEPILDYLRTGMLLLDKGINPEGVLEEAKFFGIEELYPQLENLCAAVNRPRDDLALTRRDVVEVLMGTSSDVSEMRFQGVNLAGADLSRLDLRNINFKYANMRGCNLSGANLSRSNLERVDLSRGTLDGAVMYGVKMLCANLEGASLVSCNFDDPAGSAANMEGVNLKEATLEGSNMARVNLRVATVKNANLKSCDLRGAVLAGADLEFCNLSSSDLGEANLRGANLKDTTLELMMSPLHMSQTIR